MKILLTGMPNVGKSTILQEFKKLYKHEMVGIISHEIRDSTGERVGFEAENFIGEKRIFAHKKLITSEFIIGNKYFVDKDVIDTFFIAELEKALQNMPSFLLLDEIGRMQAFSQLFLQKVNEVLSSKISILGTIVFDPEPWSLAYKNNPNVIFITVTEENRDKVPNLLFTIFDENKNFNKLSPEQQHIANALTRRYFENNQYTQVNKLFQHALPYIIENRVTRTEDEFKYSVKGYNRTHSVMTINDNLSCDCDLFKGEGRYTGQAGECSHIQSIKLFLEKTDLHLKSI